MSTKLSLFWQNLKISFAEFSLKELYLFFAFAFIFIFSLLYLIWSNFIAQKEFVPVQGGVLKEGIVGELRGINPLYAFSDVERDLSEILFEGLVGYDHQGKLVPELAESFEISKDGKTYTFFLKDNLKWSDNQPLTVDDVLFTVKLLQDPAYKSPHIASWLDIGVEKIDDKTLVFRLKKPYYPFLELATFKILPKHIWQNIPAQNIHLSPYNLKPVTSGPYIVDKIEQDSLGFIKKLTLIPNPYYSKPGPFINRLEIKLFNSEKELQKAAISGELDSFSLTPPTSFASNNFKVYQISIPRYFALFFNQEKSQILKEVKVRKALWLAIDQKNILQQVLKNQGTIVNSPILPYFYGFEESLKNFNFDLAESQLLLEEAGFNHFSKDGSRYKIVQKEEGFKFTKNLSQGSKGQEVKKLQECLAKDPEIYPEGEVTGFFGKNTEKAVIRFQEKYANEILVPQGLNSGTGQVKALTREKLNQLCAQVSTEKIALSLKLFTVQQPLLEKTAQMIKEQWEKIGVNLEIKALPLAQLIQEYLKPRNYDVLLFGQVTGIIPDLYPFWHSKQVQDPGLNLAFFKDEKADKLLLEAREAKNFQELKENYEQFQEIILENPPAVFLFNPHYLYFVSKKIKGLEFSKMPDPSKRFSQIEKWFIKTKKILK